MAAGADSIEDMDLLRDGAMGTVFGGVRAPSTLGSHLRSYKWGNVRQLGAAHREFTAALAADPRLLQGRRRVRAREDRQQAGPGQGLNPLISAISTPLAAPVLGPVRLRGGSAGSARGAASLTAEAIGTARACGCTGTILARFDSAYYSSAVIRAAIRNGAYFSVTVPMNTSIKAAIGRIGEDAWTAVKYPQALWDDQLSCWVSDAEVAETGYTAFTSRKKSEQVTARLIVRRVRVENGKQPRARASSSPPTGTTRSSPTPRSSWSRPRASTAATRSSSRSSPTWPPGRSRICPQAVSPRTRPGWSSPPSPTTCRAPPGPGLGAATRRPAPRPSAAT
jgi:hypothetical protein